jgi:hypothetical protein
MSSQVTNIKAETLNIHYEEYVKNGLSGFSTGHRNLIDQIISNRGFAPGECITLKHLNGVVVELVKIEVPKGAKHVIIAESPMMCYPDLISEQWHGSGKSRKHYIKCADYKKCGLGYVPFSNKSEAKSMARELDLDADEYLVFTYRGNMALRATVGSKPKRKKKRIDIEPDHKEAQPRVFKVAYRYFERANSKSQAFPQIRLQGKWLEEIGFHIGGFMGLTCEDGKIILTPLNQHEE